MSVDVAEVLGDLTAVTEEIERRVCSSLREAIERLKKRPHYNLMKPFIRAALGDLIKECKLEL